MIAWTHPIWHNCRMRDISSAAHVLVLPIPQVHPDDYESAPPEGAFHPTVTAEQIQHHSAPCRQSPPQRRVARRPLELAGSVARAARLGGTGQTAPRTRTSSRIFAQ